MFDSNGGLLLSRTRFEGLCHCGVCGTGRVDERGRSSITRQYVEEAEIHKRRARARAGRGLWGAARGPRRPALPLARDNTRCRQRQGTSYTLQSVGRVAGTSRPLLNKNTHGRWAALYCKSGVWTVVPFRLPSSPTARRTAPGCLRGSPPGSWTRRSRPGSPWCARHLGGLGGRLLYQPNHGVTLYSWT